MRIAKEAIPVKIDAPGAVARQLPNFGDSSGFATLGGEFFSFGAGADIAPLLQGLDDDLCQAPHWGYLISGGLVVTYADGTEELCSGSDIFYWPPGHTIRATEDSEVVLFSPRDEHTHVLDHILDKIAEA